MLAALKGEGKDQEGSPISFPFDAEERSLEPLSVACMSACLVTQQNGTNVKQKDDKMEKTGDWTV